MIKSKSNDKIKFIKSLNTKKFRYKNESYYLEGIKVINEVLDLYERNAIDLKSIAYSLDILKNCNLGNELINRIQKYEHNSNLDIFEVDKDIFYDLTDTVNTQGVLAVIKMNKLNFENFNFNRNILILDKLQDLGNIGTIIRTANSFNVFDIICIEGTGDIYSPKTLRSTMASIFKTNIMYVKENELKILMDKLVANKYNIISTCLNTDNYLSSNCFKNKNAIVVGNEANGVSDFFLNNSDVKVKIKMNDTVESLNVASATTIMLYEQYNNELK